LNVVVGCMKMFDACVCSVEQEVACANKWDTY